MGFAKNKVALIIYLATLAAFAPFSTDIYLASMPTIQRLFNTSTAQVQLTISLFFVGFSIAQLFWGPLSDRIGRKRVIGMGVAIFLLGSLLCAWSHNITQLIIARMIQSIGACSGIVMAVAVVKDIFSEKKALSKVISVLFSVAMLAPIIAPIIGSYLLIHLGWQSNFYFLALYGLLLLLGVFFIPESYPKLLRKPLPVNRLLNAYWEQIKFPPFLITTIAVSTNFSVLFAFIATSSFIYIKIYALATNLFGYFFALNAVALILGNLSPNILKLRLENRVVIFMGVLISLLGCITMILTIYFEPTSIWSVVIPLFFVTYGIGALYPEITSYALNHVVTYTGLTSSLIGTFRFVLAAVVSFFMGLILSGSAMPLAIVMFTLNIVTAVCLLIYFRYF